MVEVQKPGWAGAAGESPRVRALLMKYTAYCLYGVTEAPCEDSGARDLSYGPKCGKKHRVACLAQGQMWEYTEYSLVIPTTTSA